jgi:ABC transporter substrate binding protein (PQQ-dependent alcohol dehydrogenase system)
MTVCRRAVALCTALLTAAAAAAPTATIKVTLLARANDPRLERDVAEKGYPGHPGGPALEGVQMAIRDAAFELEAAGLAIAIEGVEVGDAPGVRATVQRAEAGGSVALLADLDPELLVASATVARRPVLNLGAADDRLRERDCSPRLWHLLPSERMRSDALAQALVARNWTRVLVLTGASADDAVRGATALASMRRYGLKVVATKPFKLSADPRERDLANPRLLTGQGDHDAVWVIDSDGEFARSLPYRTALPRPVVGDAGLVALAWQPRFDRYGAPQVSRRFARATGRPMTDHDWAAWIGGKVLVQALLAAPRGRDGLPSPGALDKALADASVDGSKGVSMSFRGWDGQLRQPLLLTDGVGVIGIAPVDGVLHPRTALDTLGADAPEKLCKARP